MFGSSVGPNGVTCASTLPSSRFSFHTAPPNPGTHMACFVRTPWYTGSQPGPSLSGENGTGFQSLMCAHCSVSCPLTQLNLFSHQVCTCQFLMFEYWPVLHSMKTSLPSTSGVWQCARRTPVAYGP